MKPHIERSEGYWYCVGIGIAGRGDSPQSAYDAWAEGEEFPLLLEALEMQERVLH